MKRFLWCYGLDRLQESSLTKLRGYLRSELGITDIFVSMADDFHPRHLNAAKLAAFVRSMKPLKTHAMILQDPCYLARSRKHRVKSTISTLAEYNSTRPALEELSGIHLDTEPHAHEDFKRAKRAGNEAEIGELFQKYQDLLCQVRHEVNQQGLNEPGFMLTAAVGWWYERRNDASVAELGKYVDAIVPMAYGPRDNHLGGSQRKLQKVLPLEAWNSRCPSGSGVILGLALREYSDLQKTIREVEAWLSEFCQRTYKGIALFSNRHLVPET